MSLQPVETDILSYLISHPAASDTLEGITEWWLLEQRITTGLKTVQRALEHLRSIGFVLEQRRPGGRLTYSLNQEKIQEIRRCVEPK
jgi:Fe2+ or Zn2+ uptake regulation protein